MATTTEERAGGPLEPRFVPNLKGVTGRLCLSVKDETKFLLELNDGTARPVAVGAATPDATLHCHDPADVARVLRGEINVIVAALQGRLYLTGDREFGARVMLGLNAGSPYKGELLEQLR
jgi:putative sterol carrier protein